MPKIFLMLKDTVVSEAPLEKAILTIGRTAGNDIVIDNLVVSSFHARIVNENGAFTLEDLNSTNGTFVNARRISQITLNNNDSIMIGKHTLLFSDPSIDGDPDKTLNARERVSEKTVMMEMRSVSAVGADVVVPAKESFSGRLTVLKGPVEKTEHEIVGRLTTIGKSKTAEIRLKGFFAPRIAALINKGKDGYYISPSANGSKVLVNGARIDGRKLLANNDTIELWKVKMQFQLQQ
jgi:pSer/pThr/pTyr-binding forkhead associated (FHA) protein